MRFIDADAFIEENAEIIDCEIDHPKYQDTLRELIDKAPTVERPQWVLCSERLPEEDGDYIATYTFCDKQVVNKVHYSKHLGFFYDSVIAWMELPAPYRERDV